ncbi:MAG: nucleotidyltransferase substrate binding protein [bacterium]
MDKVKSKYDKLVQAVKTLEQAIEDLNNIDKIIDRSIERDSEAFLNVVGIYRDSIVKRFEYCVDLLWKYVRLYLENVKQLSIETNTPKDSFRHAFQARILTKEETELALEMVQSRNQTSHIYKEEIADFVAKRAPKYYGLMLVFLSKTRP